MTGLSKISAGLFGLALLAAAPAAQAFTFENGTGGGSGAPSPFNDPTSPFNTPGSKTETLPNGATRYKFGDTTITVGNPSSPEQDFRTGVDHIFSPLGRPPD